MSSYSKARFMRLIPLCVLAFVLIFMGRDGLEQLSGKLRWLLVLCVFLALIVPMIVKGQSNGSPSTAKPPAVRYLRALWKLLLILNILGFIGGIVAVVLLRQTVPIRYMLIAPGVSLILVAVFWRQLMRTANGERTPP
jgi:hypothetical protein